jgi:glycosyltransferase involved in cell wall biosynthesis
MPRPLVSIVVPVYNDAAFLAGSLESIVKQTYNDFEVIISDDGSSDHSSDIAEQFTRRDPRFRLYTNPTNLGMTGNWNSALRQARGRYVAKLDADDAFRNRMLELLVEAMESRQRPLAAYCRALSCDQQLVPFASYKGEWALIRARMDPMSDLCLLGHIWYRMSFDDVQLWHSNAQLHRRECLLEMGGWDESWGCASDTDLILRVLEQNEPICHVPYAGVLYRHRPGSLSDRYRRQAWLRWESDLIHLASLARYHARKGRLTSQMRKDWRRIWRNWRALQANADRDLSGMRQDIRDRLMQRATEIAGPPWPVRFEGRSRQLVRNLLHRGRIL